MKKILGISLCALFAVSTANANIAAQSYVDGINTNLSGLISANTTAINGLTNSVNDHNTRITNNLNAITVNAADIADLDGRVTTNAEGIAENTSDISALTNSVNDHNTRITNNLNAITVNAADIADLDGRVTTNAEGIADINDGIAGMNFTGITGQYVTGVSQSGGQLSATGANFADTVTAGGAIAPKSSAVATYVTEQVNGINSSVGALEGRVAANEENIAEIDAEITDMTLPQTGEHYVKFVKQDEGLVSAGTGSFEEILDSGTTDNAPTSKAVANYVADNAIQGVATGGTNGTILVDNQEVAVKGLKSFAYKDKVVAGDITPGAITNTDVAERAAIASDKIAFDDTQLAVFGSGINSGLVAQISTNESAIQSVKNVADANNEALTPEGDCLTNTDGCTLVYKNGIYSWEAIKR
ncbi:MAG: hypothetical protein R8N50_01650 [Alphaproteobacteria bacterium]|nr:hypothetical protein [Alphaproteobacteria bacterium]